MWFGRPKRAACGWRCHRADLAPGRPDRRSTSAGPPILQHRGVRHRNFERLHRKLPHNKWGRSKPLRDWRPQPVDMPMHDVGAPSRTSGGMINYSIILKSIGASFVATHTASNLITSGVVALQTLLVGDFGTQSIRHRRHGLSVRATTRARLRLARHPSREMGDAATVLGLVAMLAAGTGAGEPFDLEVGGRGRSSRGAVLQHRYGHRGCVYTTTSFCRRYTLYAMASSFVIQSLDTVPSNLDRKLADRAALSAQAIG